MAAITDKLKKIREDLKTPPTLSSVEAEKITATFEAMKEVLDDTLKLVLEKDRGEAFRYTNLLVNSIQQADVNFIGGVPVKEAITPENGANEIIKQPGLNAVSTNKETVQEVPSNKLFRTKREDDILYYFNPETEEWQTEKPTRKREVVDKPDFISFTEGLTTRQMAVSNKLECFKQFPDIGDEIVCPDCSQEKMIACIRMEDPTVNPNDDFELDVKMMRKQANNS